MTMTDPDSGDLLLPDDQTLRRALELADDDPAAAAAEVREARASQGVAKWSASDHLLAGELLLDGAWVLRQHRQFEDALSFAREAAAAFVEADEAGEAAGARLLAGDIGFARHTFDAAIGDYTAALHLAEEDEAATLAARCLARLGNARLRGGDLEGGLASLEGARDASTALGDTQGVSVALRALAEALADAGRLDEALVDAEQATTVSRDAGDGRGEARALEILGGLRARGGDFEEALGDWSRARLLFIDSWDRAGEAEVCRQMAGLVQSIKQPARAAAFLLEALRIHALEGDLPGLSADLVLLARNATTTGASGRAALHLEVAIALTRRLGNDTQALEAFGKELELSDNERTAALGQPKITALHHETRMLLAEAEADLEAFVDALRGQADALLSAGATEGATAAVIVAENAIATLPADTKVKADTQLPALYEQLATAGAQSKLDDLRAAPMLTVEAIRSEAFDKLMSDV